MTDLVDTSKPVRMLHVLSQAHPTEPLEADVNNQELLLGPPP